MDIASLIDSFATGTYTVTRTRRATLSRGRAQQGTQSSFLIIGSVHPAVGNDLKKLPEGRRVNETRVLYTTTELFIGGMGSNNEADSVSIDGQDWQVYHVETWRDSESRSLGYRCIVQDTR